MIVFLFVGIDLCQNVRIELFPQSCKVNTGKNSQRQLFEIGKGLQKVDKDGMIILAFRQFIPK
jgi:hypothetical protein